MPGSRFFKAAVYYLAAFGQGICLVLIPASSFIFKSPDANGITDRQYGLLFLPMVAGTIAAAVFFKAIARRFGDGKIYYAGFLANAFYLVILRFVEKAAGRNLLSFGLLLGANLFLGIGFGLLVSVLNLLCVELFTRNRDSILTGLHSFLGIGAAAAPLLVGFFYARGTWTQGLLVVFGGLALLLLLSAALGAARLTGGECAGETASPAAFSLPPLPLGAWMFLVTIFFYGIAESIIGNWSSIYLHREKGFSIQTASLALSTFWLFVTVGRLLTAFLAIKIDARHLYRFSPVFMALSLLAIILTRAESRILFFYVAAGLACSCFFPFSISLSTRYFNAWRGRLSSMAVAALMLGAGVGSSAVGFLRDRKVINLSQAFLAAAACAVTIASTGFGLTRRKLAEGQT